MTVPPYDDSSPPLNAMLKALFDTTPNHLLPEPPRHRLANALMGLSPLPPVPNYLAPMVRNALAGPAYAKQPAFDDWRREAAWIRTAGHVDARDAHDHNGHWLDRNAKQGQSGCWQAAHIHDHVLGGPDVAWNYRAQRSSDNMAEGAYLGNALNKLFDI